MCYTLRYNRRQCGSRDRLRILNKPRRKPKKKYHSEEEDGKKKGRGCFVLSVRSILTSVDRSFQVKLQTRRNTVNIKPKANSYIVNIL